MGFSPTKQQDLITSEFGHGSNFVVEALAGTGKTSTLDLMSRKAPDEKILYVAYNKSIATEASRKFPRNVDCRTAHSLAFRAVGVRYKDRLNVKQKMSYKVVASRLGIREHFTIEPAHDVTLSPRKLARLVAETVQRFCYSGDYEITDKHVPYVKGASFPMMQELRVHLVPFARRYWSDIESPNGQLRFTHDMYLKMFQMSAPQLPYDVDLFDEAQDANPCTSSLILNQTNAQLVAVGDRNQQIYGWRGAEDAMQNWPADARLFLTKSFRFGPAIAEEANKWLELLKAPIKLEGHEPVGSTVGNLTLQDTDAILCRTNAGAMGHAIEAIVENNMRVAIVGGTNEIRQFADSVQILKANEVLPEDERRDPIHPDLFSFNTWEQVTEYLLEDGDSDPDLTKMVKLIEDNGVDNILRICSSTVSEDDAQLTISTAHKAKGREWPNVKIANDFTEPEPDPDKPEEDGFQASEAMLAYVAVTRAMKKLDPEGLQWVNHYLKPKEAV